jgi:hypothetical protein
LHELIACPVQAAAVLGVDRQQVVLGLVHPETP